MSSQAPAAETAVALITAGQAAGGYTVPARTLSYSGHLLPGVA